jgi:hypothetical protein
MTDLEGRSEMSNAQWFINYKQGKRIQKSSGYTNEKKAIEEAHKFEREYRLIVISIECENRVIPWGDSSRLRSAAGTEALSAQSLYGVFYTEGPGVHRVRPAGVLD